MVLLARKYPQLFARHAAGLERVEVAMAEDCQRRSESTSVGRNENASVVGGSGNRALTSDRGSARGNSPSLLQRISNVVAQQAEQSLSGVLRRLIVTDAALAVFESVTVAIHLEDVDVVGETIEQRAGQALGGEHTGPLIEGQIAGDDDRAAFVALAEALEQQLGAVRRERHVAQFIDDQKLVAGELTLEAQQTLFIACFVQLVDQGGGGGEADRETLLACGQT